MQSGHGKDFFSICGPVCSQGIDAFCASVFTITAEWHGAGHKCEHKLLSLLHICLHGGQSPKWQVCLVRCKWWQSGGLLKCIKICGVCRFFSTNFRYLHSCWHLGGRVLCFLPQGTAISVWPQWQYTFSVRLQG